MILYGDLNSGNCLKVKYVAEHLRIPFRFISVDTLSGETRTPDFLNKNVFGQIPVLELKDGRFLAQSNAIMRYLARGSRLLPDDPFAAAKVDEWLFWEQNEHEFFVAGCRFHMFYLGRSKASRDALRVQRGEQALDFMEQALTDREWLANGTLSIADISLVAYTQFAHEGGFDLSSRPNLTAWVRRVQTALGLPETLH
ncbi:MAG: glutathione S-transferase family protein [Proteobacteria bacterium]|nr:glutathione S-transferase family protein [Pseudomonadota bacterium]